MVYRLANWSFVQSQHGGYQICISDIMQFTHSENLDNMKKKLQKPPN